MNLYAYLIAAVVAAAVLAGTAYKAYQLGADGVRAEYTARDLKAAQDYAAKEREITEAYRAREAAQARAFAAVSSSYQAKVAANAKALDIAIAGSRLYDRAASRQTCGDSAAPAATPAGGRDGGAGAYLSDAAGGFLRRLASEADAVVLQLTACQQLLLDERKP